MLHGVSIQNKNGVLKTNKINTIILTVIIIISINIIVIGIINNFSLKENASLQVQLFCIREKKREKERETYCILSVTEVNVFRLL